MLDAIVRLKYLNSFPPEIFLILLAVYAYDIFRSRRFILYVFPLHISINLYLRVTDTITLNMVELLAWLMFAAWLTKALWRRWRGKGGEETDPAWASKPILPIVLLIYLATAIFLLFNSPFGEETIKAFVRAAEAAMVFFVLRDTIRSRRDIQVMALSLLLSSIFVGLLSWYQRFFIPDIDAYYRHIGTLADLALLPRIPWWYDYFAELSPIIRVGANIDPGGLSTGIYLPPVILLALCMAWWLEDERPLRLWGRRAALLALAGLLMGALIFTLARSGLYAFAGSLVLVALLANPKYAKYLIVVGIIVVVIAFQIRGSYTISRLLSQSADAERSVRGRLTYIERSWAIIKGSPLIGAGYDSFGKGAGQVFPHNQYLAAFQGRGIIAFLSLLAIFAIAAWEGWQLYRAATDRFLKGVVIWSLGVVASYFLHGLAHTPLDEIQIGAIFWMTLALIEAMRRMEMSQQPPQGVGEVAAVEG